MWPFTKKKSIADSDILKGVTDYHCHILPGVDDGVQQAHESICILKKMEERGVRHVWFTPHIMEDIPTPTHTLREQFDAFLHYYRSSAECQNSLTLHLSAEYMLDNLFSQRLAAGDVLPHNNHNLLVETSYLCAPNNLNERLELICEKGYTPLLAHPERYQYMTMHDYRRLKMKKIQFQLNLPSLVGCYGDNVQQKAEELLREGFYNYIGTDTHSFAGWETMCHSATLKKESLCALQKLLLS